MSFYTCLAGAVMCLASARAAAVPSILEVKHSLGLNDVFQARGSMELHFAQSSPKATLSATDLTREDGAKMKELVSSGGLYQIKIASSDDPSASHVQTAVTACDLRLANFHEEITLHVDNEGTVVGLDYKVPVGPLASTKDCKQLPMPDVVQIHSTVKVLKAADAQSIPIAAVAPAPPPGLNHLRDYGHEEQKRGPQNQSLLVRYWYIVLPVVLFAMMPAGEQEAGARGAGGGGGGEELLREGEEQGRRGSRRKRNVQYFQV